MSVLADTEHKSLVNPDLLSGIVEGDAAVVIIVEAGDRIFMADVLHSLDVGDVGNAQLVERGPTVVVGHKEDACLWIFFGQSENQNIQRTLEGVRIGIVVLADGHVQTFVVGAAQHDDVIGAILHRGVSLTHGRDGCLGVLLGHGVAVDTMVVNGHAVLFAQLVDPGSLVAQLVAVEERVADSDDGFTVKNAVFHNLSCPFESS